MVDALARGAVIALVRKGGIREQRAGFVVRHDRFLLYPTYFHENSAGLAPRLLPELHALPAPPAPGMVHVTHVADVARVWQVEALDPLRLIESEHPLAWPAVESRFHYRGTPGVQVVALRMARLRYTGAGARAPPLSRVRLVGGAGRGCRCGRRRSGRGRHRVRAASACDRSASGGRTWPGTSSIAPRGEFVNERRPVARTQPAPASTAGRRLLSHAVPPNSVTPGRISPASVTTRLRLLRLLGRGGRRVLHGRRLHAGVHVHLHRRVLLHPRVSQARVSSRASGGGGRGVGRGAACVLRLTRGHSQQGGDYGEALHLRSPQEWGGQ